MSLFLGKIHFGLYNKIQEFELIEKDLLQWTKEKNLSLEELTNKLSTEFGLPFDNRPLEEIVDNSNIHGWFQNKISNAELRQASLITEILNIDENYKSELTKIFKTRGTEAAHDYSESIPDTPETIYHLLNNVILEGMPCDRVIKIIESNKVDFIWEVTMCLHKPYWDKVGGEVKNFYDLREIWVESFIKTINPRFKYVKTGDFAHKILMA